MSSKFLLCVAFLAGAGACSDSVNFTKLEGSYDAEITLFGNTDQNVLSVSEGAKGTLLLDFTTGLRSDPAGTSPNGIRANINGSKLKIASQPAFLDNPAGTASGTIAGNGTITVGMPNKVALTLMFTTADIVDFVQPNDGGSPTRVDGGSGGVVTLTVAATKQAD